VPEIELTAGVLDYEDNWDAAPVIVLLHGLLMTGSLWDDASNSFDLAFTASDRRCRWARPAERCVPRRTLSLQGQVRLLVESLERLELNQVTLVFNDRCGAQLLVSERWDARVEQLVLASCETYDHDPPGLPGRIAARAAEVPGGLSAALKPLRFKVLRASTCSAVSRSRTSSGPSGRCGLR
jgi:pimeloyl-ACP methyl ester carboxylesterase